MYINEGYKAGIIPLAPQGTNSTLFTECCRVAIYDESCCPLCQREVIGSDAPLNERHKVRWRNATRHWAK